MFGFKEKKAEGARGEPLPVEHEGPPDTYRPYGLCPRCGKQSSFKAIGTVPVTFDGSYMLERDGREIPGTQDQVSVLLCRNCGQGVAVVEEKWVGEEAARKQKTGGMVTFRGIHWWPLPGAVVQPDVPPAIASAYAEAVTCLSAGAWRAAAAMARRTLEGIAEDQGETKGDLRNRLNALAARNVLQPSLADWSKEVRLVGNAGAHFDIGMAVAQEDAEEIVGFIRELLRYLYEMPAELLRRRSKPKSA